MQVLPNGIGVSGGGHVLLGSSPLQISGDVWFVDSASGADAGSPRGKNQEYPLATLAQAVTNAATGDVIVLLSTHDETITANINIGGKQLVIIGEGRTSGVPSATLNNNCAADTMLEFSSGSTLINVRFVSGGSDVRPHFECNGGATGCFVAFCQFETGLDDTTYSRVLIDGPNCDYTFEDCVFKSTATDPTAAPKSLIANASPCANVKFRRCTFDGGQSGFASNGYAVDFTAQAVTDLLMEAVIASNGADIGLHADTTGIVNVTATGASRVVWL